MFINPKKINRNNTEKILTKLYQTEGKTFFIYRLTESGQHVITRSYVDNAKMVIDHVPVFFNENEVYLDYRVGGREHMSYGAWLSYLYVMEKEDLLYR